MTIVGLLLFAMGALYFVLGNYLGDHPAMRYAQGCGFWIAGIAVLGWGS